MEVELKINQLLSKYNLKKHGVEKDMAEKCGMHRHTIAKLLKNESPNPSLQALGKISRYLIANGVPAAILPGALLGGRPDGLWRAIGSMGLVAIYLGMYKHITDKKQPGPGHMTLAIHDANAASKINHLLALEAGPSDERPIVHMHYVPFQYRPPSVKVEGDWFDEDKRYAMDMYGDMKDGLSRQSAILIGSQRINYLVEHLVADMFGCEPFKPIAKKSKVPFFVSYRDFDRRVPSCFGGRELPAEIKHSVKKGIWFVNEDGKWELGDWKKHKKGSGIVITIREADSVVMALFGFSGRSTKAICNEIIKNPKGFWETDEEGNESPGNGNGGGSKGRKNRSRKTVYKNTVTRKATEIAVYICRTKFYQAEGNIRDWTEEEYAKDEVEITPISKEILDRYLPKRWHL